MKTKSNMLLTLCMLAFAFMLAVAPMKEAAAVSNDISATEGTFKVHKYVDGVEVGSMTVRAKGFDKTQDTSCRFAAITWDVYSWSGTMVGASLVSGLNYTYKGEDSSTRYPMVGCTVGMTKEAGIIFDRAEFVGNGGSGGATIMKDGVAHTGQTLAWATDLNTAQNPEWTVCGTAQSVYFGLRLNYVEYMMDHHADINIYFRTPKATITYQKGDYPGAVGGDVVRTYDYSGTFADTEELGMSRTIQAKFDETTKNYNSLPTKWEIPGFTFIVTEGTGNVFQAGVNEMLAFANMQTFFDTYGIDFRSNPVVTAKAHWAPVTVTTPEQPTAEKYTISVTSENTMLDTIQKSKNFEGWLCSDGTTYSAGVDFVAHLDVAATSQWSYPTLDITTLTTPKRDGYKFTGWTFEGMNLSDDSEDNQKVINSYNYSASGNETVTYPNLVVTKDMTITASWEKLPDPIVVTNPYNNDTIKALVLATDKLTQEEKDALLARIEANTLTAEDKELLETLVKESTTISDQVKQEIITTIEKASNSSHGLSKEQAQAIMDALEKGSSATFSYGGVTYQITKNGDGSLSISIKDLGGKKDVTIPNEIILNGKAYPVTIVGNGAFKGNKTLETVTIPGNVTKIGDSAFEGCSNLKKVNLTKGLVTIGNKAFKDCVKLQKIVCPSTLQSIGVSAFENCTKLTSIKFNEGLLVIKKRAFYNAGLKSISLPKTLLKIEMSAFEKCKKMKKVTFASDIKMATVGYRVFANDTSLKKIALPKNLRSIPKRMFYNCKSLSKVTGGVRVTNVGESAFEGCKKLPSITLRTKVQKIAKKAFYNCSKLKTVNIKSKALTKVESKAFKKCKKKIKFNVPRVKIKAYKKLLKGKY